MSVKCPKCKMNVPGLVKKYSIFNKETGKGQSIEVEKAVCEFCIQEAFDEIQAKVQKEN